MKTKKKYRRLIVLLLLLGAILYLLPCLYCRTVLNTSEAYPEDAFLKSETNRRALIIVAHDDDCYGCAGTVRELCEKGWEVSACCFYPEPVSEELADRNRSRKEGIRKCSKLLGLEGFIGIDMNLRISPAEEAYRSIPYTEFEEVYLMDSVKSVISQIITRDAPSVIFTLDDSIGLYGHPEHVLISQMITSICKDQRSQEDFPVKRIYQSVLPPDMAEGILVKYSKLHPYLNCKRLYWHWTQRYRDSENIYTEAKQTYGCSGMPSPDVEISVREYSRYRKGFITCFPTERKNFKRFVPFFHWYTHRIYYGVFDKEYFRILEI